MLSVEGCITAGAMDESLYDEFGNYVGPELSGSEEEEEEEQVQQQPGAEDMDAQAGSEVEEDGEEEDDGAPSGALVLHEDKKYYPSAEELYGAGTETLVQEEDAQPLEVPIVAPVRRARHEAGGPALAPRFTPEFLGSLLATPELCRNVTLAGHIHAGKTLLMDMLVEQTHVVPDAAALADAPMRYTDTRADEQRRGISIKAAPVSLVVQGLSGKSYVASILDAPGHLDFGDELSVSLRLSDGMLLAVDAAEGAAAGTERAVRAAAAEGLAIALVVTKVDRLITELKLPPADAYHKLRHVVEEVNALVRAHYPAEGAADRVLDPRRGNVAFAAPLYGWSFTLESFAVLQSEVQRLALDPRELARRLWGDLWYHADVRAFRRAPPAGGGDRSFVQFVLEPLYKIYATVLGENDAAVRELMAELGVALRPAAYGANVRPLLKEACTAVFGSAAGLVEVLVRSLPSARAGTATKVARWYTGPQDSEAAGHMRACNPRGPLAVYVTKLFPTADATAFDLFGRVLSGTVKPGDKVRVLGEAYTPEDEEDAATATVTGVWAAQGRARQPLARAVAGNWVLLGGLDATVAKTATLVPEFGAEEAYIFAPLTFGAQAVVKIATEPLNPSELPKMVEGLRKLNKSYPMLVTKVEESGEHTIFGTGELYLDSVMKDLREMYAEVEVKVADPVVAFCETVVETSSLKCFAETPNKKNKITMIAEPLEKGLAEDIERGAVSMDWTRKEISTFFQSKYDWDILAARSIWAFGPDNSGPNILMDDTLPSEVDKTLLNAVRESIVQGFQWGAREGPLCDEPLRNCKFKIMDAVVAPEPLHRGGGQVIPTARRACYSAFLMATPRLMEPVYAVEIQTPADCIAAIYNVLAKRRGHVTADVPRPGTPVFLVRAFLPVIESFGFETDLRYHTQGQAFCLSAFDHWQIVPGDPLDRSVVLRPLEPAPVQALARDFMVKTRRRKGMSDDVSVNKYFDDPMLLELARQDAELNAIF